MSCGCREKRQVAMSDRLKKKQQEKGAKMNVQLLIQVLQFIDTKGPAFIAALETLLKQFESTPSEAKA